MSCRAVKNGEVKIKGKATIEFYKDGKPQYYCEGYIDNSLEALMETSRNCKNNVIYA